MSSIGDVGLAPDGTWVYRPPGVKPGIVPLIYNGQFKQYSMVEVTGKLPSTQAGDGLREAEAFARKILKYDLEAYPDDKSVSRYVFITEDSGWFVPHVCHGPCHARLNRVQGGRCLAVATSPNVKMWKTWNNGGSSRDAGDDRFGVDTYEQEAMRFWEWLVLESPFKDAFVAPVSAAEAESDGILVSVHCPGNLAAQAITATRMPHEFPGRVRVWHSLVERGVDPTLALVLSESVLAELDEVGPSLKVSHRGGGIHDMFPEYISLEAVGRIRRMDIQAPTRPLKDKCAFGGQHDMWGGRGNSLRAGIRLRPSDNKGQVIWSWETLSLVRNAGPGGVQYEDGINQLAEQAKQWEKELA